MDIYVYYKVQAAQAAGLQGAVFAMQAALSAAHGVVAQLKRRPEAPEGVQTWMEVYPAVAGLPFLAALNAAVAEAGLARWISGPRHVEIFEDLPPCA
ncbi:MULTISPECIES: DUF4936 family protein [unclassified Duganella]|uniref:DUF4936 family protein n=1 Tax=unclassified Duganella TaxID=2636909 RepID=UPI0006FBF425|nr:MULTISPECIES: DUF4936 family protein [unclassified Duganella]KQV61360.1 hypothetical protein ASD07_00380 [Duganella sp. Root336D2]KRB92551.1 hypothetical protein ASE26_06200 [Duganella sp. Root198D2]